MPPPRKVPPIFPPPHPPNHENGNGSDEEDDFTARFVLEALESVPPTPQNVALLQWVKSANKEIKDLRQRVKSDPPKESDPPMHKTRELVDWIKWAVMTVVGIAAIGWLGHEYISGFQTKEEARAAQTSNDTRLGNIQQTLSEQDTELEHQREAYIRMELSHRSMNDRLDQLLILNRAETLLERRQAERRIHDIQVRIDRRTEVVSNRRAMERLSAAYQQDPLTALENL